MTWGSHFIIDANGCEGNFKDIGHIKEFIYNMCLIGNMKRKGELIVEEFEDNQFNRENDLVGYSVVQIISLSNITLHINFISKTIYFDFFSCGIVNESLIVSLFDEFFKPKQIKKIKLLRDAIDYNLDFI